MARGAGLAIGDWFADGPDRVLEVAEVFGDRVGCYVVATDAPDGAALEYRELPTRELVAAHEFVPRRRRANGGAQKAS